MKKIISKTQLVLILSAFLVACGGGGGSGSSNSSASVNNNVVNPNNGNSSAANGHESTLADLKEKEARQKAEEKNREEEKKAQEEAKNLEEKNKAEQPKVEEPKVEEPKVEEPKVEEPKAEEPKAEEPKVEEPKVEEPKVEEPKVEKPKVEEPKVNESVIYTGYSISDGVRNSWNGEEGNTSYQVKKEGDQFKAVSHKPESITVIEGDNATQLMLISDKADLGYYGYVSTFAKNDGISGQNEGQKRTADFLYAVNEAIKDSKAPTFDGYEGTVNYGGNFFYSTDNVDNINKADISLNYSPSNKTLNGNIINTQQGLDLRLKQQGDITGEFMMSVEPAKGQGSGHTSDRVTEKGILNGQFLDNGKHIVGDASAGDNNKQWRGVFSASETGRVDK